MPVSVHNPDQYMASLRQILAQGRKRLGILVGAGGPAGVRVDKATGKLDPNGESLLPAVDGLTVSVLGSLEKDFGAALKQVKADLNTENPNIEAILSRIRSLALVLGTNSICELDGAGYKSLAEQICKKIGEVVNVPLPSEQNPFSELVGWIGGVARDHPIEIFTPNYDLLFEEAFERAQIPYFDGFVGSHEPFFDQSSVASNDLPPRWARLWKLHGSLGWGANSRGECIRTGRRDSTNMIFPDHLKYDQIQKLPFSAFLDRLKQFLMVPDTLLIAIGFSFSDFHITARFSECLSANPSASIFAFQFRALAEEMKACALARQRTNLSVYARDGAVINGIDGVWRPGDPPSREWATIRATYWGRPENPKSEKDPAEFTLGRFAALTRFFALSKALEPLLSAPTLGETA